jgi:hypothetical protein
MFKRLASPNQAIVTMGTNSTRTFGFFGGVNVYVAVSIQTLEILKPDPDEGDPTDHDPYKDQAEIVKAVLKYIDPSDVDATTDVESLVTP